MRRPMVLAAAAMCIIGVTYSAATDGFVRDFSYAKADMVSSGANAYFILKPGYQLRLKSDTGDLVITVTDQTKSVDGVLTRVVEEREKEDGKLIEVSRNYFALSRRDNSVYYFGEDVDIYRNGKVTSHQGAWLAGVRGAKAGLMMPGSPRAGMKYYQEVAPGVAMDRAEIIGLTETLKVPAGQMKNVLKTLETTPLEPKARDNKYYVKGIGLIKDGDMMLVKHGYVRLSSSRASKQGG